MRAKLILPIFLAVLVFLPFLDRRDIVTSHEARLIQASRLMADSGLPWNSRHVSTPAAKLVTHSNGKKTLEPDLTAPPLSVNPWLIPVLNGEIRIQKPPLPYWLTAILFRFQGDWSPSLARILPAVMGALCLLLIYGLARDLLGRRTALPAAMAWVSTHFLSDEFRKAMADPCLAFFTLATIYFHLRSTLTRKITPALLAWFSLALGLLSKGPPMLPFVAIPVLLIHFLQRRPSAPIRHHLAGLLLAAAIVLPWPILVLTSFPQAMEFWRYQSLGNLDNVRPWHSYLVLLPQLALPWTPAMLCAMALPFLRKKKFVLRLTSSQTSKPTTPSLPRGTLSIHSRLLPMIWLLSAIAFMSIFSMKKAAYLLPATPAMCLLIAQGIVAATAATRRWGVKSLPAALLAGQSLIAIAFAAALPYFLFKTGISVVLAISMALPAIILGIASFRHHAARRHREHLNALTASYTLAIVLLINFVQTAAENDRSPRPAVAHIQSLLAADPAATILPRQLPPEASLYFPLNLSFNPAATTIYHLADDRHNEFNPTLADFQKLYPQTTLQSAARIEIPKLIKPRYKLFKLTALPPSPLAQTHPTFPH